MEHKNTNRDWSDTPKCIAREIMEQMLLAYYARKVFIFNEKVTTKISKFRAFHESEELTLDELTEPNETSHECMVRYKLFIGPFDDPNPVRRKRFVYVTIRLSAFNPKRFVRPMWEPHYVELKVPNYETGDWDTIRIYLETDGKYPSQINGNAINLISWHNYYELAKHDAPWRVMVKKQIH